MSRTPYDWRDKVYHNCKIVTPLYEDKVTGGDHWNILCHCGKTFLAQAKEVKRGNIVSCGCFRRIASKERITKQIKNNNGLGIGTQKQNYRNYISKNNIKILEPVDQKLDTGKDLWYAICPKCGKTFTTQPNYVIQKLQSCGCFQFENMKLAMKEKRLKVKEENGGIWLTELNQLFRSCIYSKIRHIIFEVDNYTCSLCLKHNNQYFNIHHIDPIKLGGDFKFEEKQNFYKLYDINNLITLCKKCHIELAHNSNGQSGLNLEIQKELQAITSMRIIPKNIQNEYNQIVKETIEPWIENYLSAKINS